MYFIVFQYPIRIFMHYIRLNDALEYRKTNKCVIHSAEQGNTWILNAT